MQPEFVRELSQQSQAKYFEMSAFSGLNVKVLFEDIVLKYKEKKKGEEVV